VSEFGKLEVFLRAKRAPWIFVKRRYRCFVAIEQTLVFLGAEETGSPFAVGVILDSDVIAIRWQIDV
jgi:hypothetical protein